MARILVLLVIAVAIYFLFRAFFRAQSRDEEKVTKDEKPAVEDMVACARCGVNQPLSETREEGGRRVCANNPNCSK